MKTRQMLSILTLLAICLFTNAQEKLHCSYEDCDFTKGEVVYLFGDDVLLREAPTVESKILGKLEIGTHMVILEKHKNSWPYKGIDSPFYKVDYKGTEGYILGGLIALEKKTVHGVTHLFGRAKSAQQDYLLIRTLKGDGKFTEKSVRLDNPQFYLTAQGNKGLSQIDAMLYVDYLAEGCGVEGGRIYFFQKGDSLYQVARLSQIFDAGVYAIQEEFIFPEDVDGVEGKIRYTKELAEYYDDAANWEKKSLESKELVWTDHSLGLAQR